MTLVRARGAPRLRTFSIGLAGSPDLAHARDVAAHLGTDHREYQLTPDALFATIPDCVKQIESYDITTVRASAPMLALCRRIKADTEAAVILSGEGSDELLCGYLYFHLAPSAEAAAEESARKVRSLHMYDCQRANMATMGASLEARVPFLDLAVLRVAMQRAAPEHKTPRPPSAADAPVGRVEKALLRDAFAESGLLPAEVLWRQKEQFGDGVGHSWIDSLRAHAAKQAVGVDRLALGRAYGREPTCDEQAWYMQLFMDALPGHVGEAGSGSETWVPEWNDDRDPSGRSVRAVYG